MVHCSEPRFIAMDSAPNPLPTLPTPPHLKASASKLPIKRKIPFSDFLNPSSFPTRIASFTTAPCGGGTAEDDVVAAVGEGPQPPPSKFHRIWTEPDEIQFLQGLLGCSSENLFFPRDLDIFYARFSNTMSQPYTKTQLSEKLRRLRKKFRVVSTRLAKGLDWSVLSPHDRELYGLSKRLWDPEFAGTSPFTVTSNGKLKNSDLIGVTVSYLPALPLVAYNQMEIKGNVEVDPIDFDEAHENYRSGECDLGPAYRDYGGDCGEVKLSEVNVELENGGKAEDFTGNEGSELEGNRADNGSGKVEKGSVEELVAKAVTDAIDESFKVVKKRIVIDILNLDGYAGKDGMESFEKRWQEQTIAELEVLAQRLRLVYEHSVKR